MNIPKDESSDNLTLDEKLDFLKREVPDRKFKTSNHKIFYLISHLKPIEVTDDYFKARVSDWLIANQDEETPTKNEVNPTNYHYYLLVSEYFSNNVMSITSIGRLSNSMAGEKK